MLNRGRFRPSMSPVKRLLFVAPRLNVPPYSNCSAFVSFVKRVSWNANSGLSSWPDDVADCQKGVALEDAIDWKPIPIKPEIGAWSNCDDV